MAYSKTSWANGTTPAISAANLNKIENGIETADANATSGLTKANDLIFTEDYYLNSKLDKQSTKTDLSGSTTSSAYWKYSTKSFSSNNNYQCLVITSGFNAGDMIEVHGYQSPQTTSYAICSFYDSNGNELRLVFKEGNTVIPEGTSTIYINGKTSGTTVPSAKIITYINSDIFKNLDALQGEDVYLEDSKLDKTKVYTEISGTKTDNKLWNYNSNSESSATNYHYVKISSGFTAGKVYAFDGQQASSTITFASIVFYDSSMNKLGVVIYDVGAFKKKACYVPLSTAYIYINGSNNYTSAKMFAISYEELDASFTIKNFMQRRYQDGEYEVFTRKTLDHLIVTFSIDDSNADVSDLANEFIEAEIPLCLATIPSKLNNVCNDGTTVLNVCTRVQAAGGEILCHNGTPLDSETTDEEFYNYFVTSKKTLIENGLNVNGIIKAGGESDYPNTKTCKTYLRSYYDYGTGFQYINDNRYNSVRFGMSAELSTLKQYVDNNLGGGILNFYAHGSSDMGEGWVDKVMELVAYIQSKENTEIVTIGEMFLNNYIKSFAE